MDTKKLFYEDCHLTRFCATVISCEKTEKGFRVVLDQTAFYPEGGGQPCDLGTLNGIPVLDVREQGDQIVHFCREAMEVGSRVEGCVDWQRRFPRRCRIHVLHPYQCIFFKKEGRCAGHIPYSRMAA